MQFNYKLPPQYVGGAPLNPADIKQVNLGVRLKSGTAGTYPYGFTDVTFQADSSGISHEALDSFGALPPGTYIPAAQVVMKDVNGVPGGVSDWQEGVEFPVPAPKPNPPTGVAVS